MKFLKFAVAPMIFFGSLSAVYAQSSVYTDPSECMTQVGALDKDGDGYVSDTEMAGRGSIESNVDTDGDGRISKAEMTVSCDSKTMRALTPNS